MNGLDTRSGMHGLMEGFDFADRMMTRREQRDQAKEEADYQRSVVRPMQEESSRLALDSAKMTYGRARDKSNFEELMLAQSMQEKGDNSKMDELVAANPANRRWDYRFYASDDFVKNSAQVVNVLNSETEDGINDQRTLEAMEFFHPEFVRQGEVPIKGIAGIMPLDDSDLPTDAEKSPAGHFAVFVKAVGKDGKEYNASRTVNQSTDPNDKTIAFSTDEMLNRTYGALEVGNNVRKFKTPAEQAAYMRAQATAIYNQNFGDKKTAPEYTSTTAYDEKTGTKRTAMVNKNNPKDVHWVGGAAADDDGDSGSGSGSGRKGKNASADMLKQYFADLQQIRLKEYSTQEERDAAVQDLNKSYADLAGFDPDSVAAARDVFRQQYGREPNLDEIQQMDFVMRKKADAYQRALAEKQTEDAAAANQGLANVNAPPKSGAVLQHERYVESQQRQDKKEKEIAQLETKLSEHEKQFSIDKKLNRMDQFAEKQRADQIKAMKVELASLRSGKGSPAGPGLADAPSMKTADELLASKNPADIAAIDAIIADPARLNQIPLEQRNALALKKIQLMTTQSSKANRTAGAGL